MEVDSDDDKKTLNVEATTMDLGNAEEPINNDAKICSPEVSDILPIFANMLDVKSFMNLAMTCKGMYKRCMEDKTIKIKVDENRVGVYSDEGGVGFYIQSSFVSEKNLRSYVATLRKQRFSLNINAVRIDGTPTDIPSVNAARNHLMEIGVNRIEILYIYRGLDEWDAIIPFIKEFGVNVLCMYCISVPHPILRSLLQLNLDQFEYDGPFPVQLFLEVDSPIRKIVFQGLKNIEWDKYIQMLGKIQSGPLQRLTLDLNAVNWVNDEPLKYDREDELPEHRPLVFKRETDIFEDGVQEYFFLHWHGGITKDVTDYSAGYTNIFKCAPNEFPPILRKDEDILKDLTEIVPMVACSERQFSMFIERFTLIEPSYEGPLPTGRPLYFKSENGFCKLTEDDELMECAWKDGLATWKPFDCSIWLWHLESMKASPFEYRALVKLMFIERLQQPNKYYGEFDCEGLDELDFWLEDYKKLDFEYSDALPKERPLVFKKRASEEGNKKFCVILFDNHLLQCDISGHKAELELCKPWNRPPIFIDADTVKEFFEKAFLCKRAHVSMPVDHDTFLSGFQLFKTSLNSKRVFERTQKIDGKLMEERCFFRFGGLSMITWRDGYVSLSNTNHHEVPPQFAKELFKECVQVFSIRSCCSMSMTFPEHSNTGISMDLKQLESCLELFEAHPFDYCGPLPKDRTLAFVKKEIHHVCKDGQDTQANCGCSESSYHVWFLSDGVKISYCSWRAETPQLVMFSSCENLPPMLGSKLYLESLLQMTEVKKKSWYGTVDDFLACFERYTKITSSHKGPFPEERPLLLEKDANDEYERYLLREDGKIIECKWTGSNAIVNTIYPFAGYPPSVLKSAW